MVAHEHCFSISFIRLLSFFLRCSFCFGYKICWLTFSMYDVTQWLFSEMDSSQKWLLKVRKWKKHKKEVEKYWQIKLENCILLTQNEQCVSRVLGFYSVFFLIRLLFVLRLSFYGFWEQSIRTDYSLIVCFFFCYCCRCSRKH